MGEPKALLMYRGETFLERLVGIFEPLCTKVVVVLGCRAEQIVSGIKRPIRSVVNSRWQDGQLSSLQAGLAELENSDFYFYTPVDFPAVDSQTPGALLSSIRESDLLAIPRYGEKRGHPILFRHELRAEFMALRSGEAARDVVHRHVDRTTYVDVQDPGILIDVDEPADYRALVGEAR